MKEIQPGIFEHNGKLYTRNADPGEKVYGEGLRDFDGVEYRRWDPKRSKAGAAVKNGIDLGMERDDEVLYLGAASGTTVSHFSDILEEGFIVGVEYSDTVIRGLVELAERRDNIAPFLGDARKPEKYEEYVDGADVVFQDISQRDQAQIFLKNCRKFLKEGGVGLLAVKARSISSSRDKEDIYDEVRDKVSEEFEIVDETELAPYETEHLFLKIEG
ncbi:MAG: fibrillarin-like rRNA/tRNA 2'-O-methyltransferase [Candidatus Nanohalobium sp.]